MAHKRNSFKFEDRWKVAEYLKSAKDLLESRTLAQITTEISEHTGLDLNKVQTSRMCKLVGITPARGGGNMWQSGFDRIRMRSIAEAVLGLYETLGAAPPPSLMKTIEGLRAGGQDSDGEVDDDDGDE